MLDKVLASFAYPLGGGLVCLLLAFLVIALGARRSGLVLGLAVTMALWSASTPIAARWMLETLEAQYPVLPVDSYRPADVAILLGGALKPPATGEQYPDLGEAADRVVQAYRIYKAALAPRILVSGGNVFPDGRMSEGRALADLLVDWGVDRKAILIDEESRNTFENAREAAKIWQREGLQSGLLVTSAAHMPRALAVFRKAGLIVEPAATDQRSKHPLPPFPLSILPDAESLDQTSQVIKEWIGLAVYRWRGWA